MRSGRRFVRAAVAAGLLALPAGAALVNPPADLGELARMSEAVVLVTALGSTGTPGPYLPHTMTRFRVLERVAGAPLPREIEVVTPGGTVGGRAVVVPGSPRFRPGETYLLFLSRAADGRWRVRTLAYGAFERAVVAGEEVLRPVPERRGVGLLRRFDVEVPGTYRLRPLLTRLRDAAAGRRPWSPEGIGIADPRAQAKAAPAGCDFMTYSDGNGIRWFGFDSGTTADVVATTPGQTGLADGGQGAVQGGADAWTGDPGSLIQLVYGGTAPQSISCTAGDDAQLGAVVFDDPCGDIPALNNCAGTLAYGGPSFSLATQTFDGQQWHPAGALFVVVNDGAECIGDVNFAEMITHELGHGLGFGHHTDPDATMYAYCCHYPRGAALAATDQLCAAYLYPDTTATAPAPPASLTATAVSENRIDLAWTDVTDETGYRVYRSFGGPYALVADLPLDQVSWSDTSLSACTTASYYVTAYNASGESGPSPTASATTPGQVPEAPALAGAEALDPTRVRVWWTNGAVQQDTVEVHRAVGSGAFQLFATLAGTATEYVDGAVTSGESYRYRLRAVNSCGTSGWSAEAAVTVPSGSEPLSADFSWDPVRPWDGEEVTFSAATGGGPDSLEWSFGDGTGGSGSTVVHRYEAPGSYEVRLTARRGTEAVTASHTVTVIEAPRAVPAAARTEGVGGTSWRTDLAVLWPGPGTREVAVQVRDANGTVRGTRSLRLEPGQLEVLTDLVGGMGWRGTGSVVLSSAQSLAEALLLTRTYTGPAGATYGQAIPLERGRRQGTVYVPGVRGGPGFRTNFGFASVAEGTTRVTLRLHLPGGTVPGPSLELPAGGQAQWNLESLFGGPVLDGIEAATLEVRLDAPAVPYISVVDEVTGDPVYVPGRPAETAWIIPVVGRGPGERGTVWDTELVLFNPSPDTGRSVRLEYLPAGVSNVPAGPLYVMTLAPGETRLVRELERALWGVERGLGAVSIEADGPVAVEARIATPSPDGAGTMGQRIPPLSPGEVAGPASVVCWVREDGVFRTNVGVVNLDSRTRAVTLVLHAADGSELARSQVQVPARSLLQRALSDLFPSVASGTTAAAWISVEGAAEGLILYASQVDNGTGDPTYVPGG